MVLVSGLGVGCVADDGASGEPLAGDPEAGELATVEQGSFPSVFVLRSVSVPGQVVDVLLPQSGALVRLGPANITSQQRWQFSELQIRYNNVPGLCLQPESAAVGARLILRPCVTPVTLESMQAWNGHLDGSGRVSWRNSTTQLWIDASAGAFGVLRQQPETNTTRQDFTLSSN